MPRLVKFDVWGPEESYWLVDNDKVLAFYHWRDGWTPGRDTSFASGNFKTIREVSDGEAAMICFEAKSTKG